MTVKIKICGITKQENIECCIENSADMIGFVFYPDSPRNIKLKDAIAYYNQYSSLIEMVGLVVNPEDYLVDEIINEIGLNTIQFHGDEDINRLERLKRKSDIKIIKALPLKDLAVFDVISHYKGIVDYVLFDSPKPKKSIRPGGNGELFDWSLLSGYDSNIPYILSGGLNVNNVKKAIEETRANFVDVSSGVENELGKKDNDLIRKFIYNANQEKLN
tara:strand:+ start:17698 stop:18348 length:651 start_codon:yes stop_codon:yes gene_type:complete